MKVFADASEMGDFLAIGALLFRNKHIRPFEKEWQLMLQKYGLTHFHMTDCNAAEGEFKGMSEYDCDQCARRAIALVLKFAAKGTVFSVKKEDFYEIITKDGIVPNPFTLGSWATLMDIANWADINDKNASISYVFEAGDEHQGDANRFLDCIAYDQERRIRFRYRNHLFVPKRESMPTQAADILAWHGAKHIGRRSKGVNRLRGDFQAIIDGLKVADAHYDRVLLEKLVTIARKSAGTQGNKLAGFANRYHSLKSKEQARQLSSILGEDGALERLIAIASGRGD